MTALAVNGSAGYIKDSPHHGRGLFATKALLPGDLVFELARPLIAVLDRSRLSNTCSNCFLGGWSPLDAEVDSIHHPLIGVKACAGCSTLWYCSKKCQAQSWKRSHKVECKLLKAISARGMLPNAARAVLQMIFMCESESCSPFNDLKSHIDEIKAAGGPRLQTLRVMCSGLRDYSATQLDLNTIQQLLAIVLTNSLSLMNATFDQLGMSLDPFAAMVNHSCDPNAVFIYDGPKLSFRTLKNIEKDEEILISYIDSTNPFFRRQKELKERFYFTCQCVKCMKGPTLLLEDTFPKSLREIGSLLDGSVRNVSAVDFSNHPPVGSEDYLGSDPVYQRLGSLQRFGFERVDQVNHSEDIREQVNSIESAVRFFLQAPIWPVTRQPVPALLQNLFVSLLQPGEETWLRALRIGIKMVCVIDPFLFPQRFHPIRVVHLWTLAKLTLFLHEQQDDVKLRHETQTLVTDTSLDLPMMYMTLVAEIWGLVGQSHGSESSFGILVRKTAEAVKSNTEAFPDMLKSNFEQQRGIMYRIAVASDI